MNAKSTSTLRKDEVWLFAALLAGSVLFSYLSIAIPGTEAHFDVRSIFVFLGFALLRGWVLPLLVALAAAAAGPHQISLAQAVLFNLLYLVPTFLLVRALYPRVLGKISSRIGYAAAWVGVILLCYELFFTPVIWGAIAYLRGMSIVPMVIEGWKEQPFLVESVIVAVVSALSLLLYRIHTELIEAQTELRTTLYSIGDGVIATDVASRVRRMNREAEHLTGWTEGEAQGRPLEEVFVISNEETGNPVETPVRRVLQEGQVVGLANHTVLHAKDGPVRPILDSGAPIRTKEGDISGVVLVFRDQTAERAAEREMKNALAERDILLRELYHRTKNNMNVICSMLALRAAESGSPEVRQLVRETESRIHTIALVHEKLYQAGNLSQIDLQEYLGDLARLLVEGYRQDKASVTLETDLEPVPVTIDTAVPCGLLLNELISNALKHAFPDGRSGVVTVGARMRDSQELELRVSDNGVGMDPCIDFRKSLRLGSQTIALLVEHQLQGRFEVERDRGTTFRAILPYQLYPKRV
jgi:PAS domain S-box-containing protein